MKLWTFLTQLFNFFVVVSIIFVCGVFANYIIQHISIHAVESVIKPKISTVVTQINPDNVKVVYDVKLDVYPVNNPTVFLEYTLNLPNFVHIDKIILPDFLKYEVQKHSEFTTIRIKPKSKRLVISKPMKFQIKAIIPMNMQEDKHYKWVFIPHFDKIDLDASVKQSLKEQNVLFQPFVTSDYSLLVTVNKQVFLSVLEDVLISFVVLIQVLSGSSFVNLRYFVGFVLAYILFSSIIVYNMLWIIKKLYNQVQKLFKYKL